MPYFTTLRRKPGGLVVVVVVVVGRLGSALLVHWVGSGGLSSTFAEEMGQLAT
jgi:hypothetical protein